MQSGNSHHSQNVVLEVKSFFLGMCLMPGSAEHWWDCVRLPKELPWLEGQLQPALAKKH